MSEPTHIAIARMNEILQKADLESNVSFRFKLPAKGLSLRSVAIVDGVPKLNFDAANSTQLATITEEDVAVIARLVYEGKRPEFFYIAIPPSHPFYGRQYKLYSPQWLRGTSVGETYSEVDWKMKCVTIGVKTNASKTEFWEASGTSKLEGRMGTIVDFPRDQLNGSVKMSCKSVKVEETENDIVFIGEPKMQIKSDSSPSYSKYITDILDKIAYYDEPEFLRMQELTKLILGMEFLKKRGVTFDKEWFMEQTTKNTRSASQAVEVCDSEVPRVDFEEMLKHMPPEAKDILQVEKKVKSGVKFTKKGIPGTTLAVSVNDYDTLYDGFDPKEPLGHDNSIIPDVDSWSEFYRQTVPWPRVWIFPHTAGMRTAGGGITSSHIPTSRVPVGTSSKHTTRMQKDVKRKGQYEKSGELLSVSSSTVPPSSTRGPPGSMVPKCEKPIPPSRVVGPLDKQSRALQAKFSSQRMYGFQDQGSIQMHSKDGQKCFQAESMKFVSRETNEAGEEQRMFARFPLIHTGNGTLDQLVLDGASDMGDDGCLSPSDCGDRLPFCSPIGSDDEMD